MLLCQVDRISHEFVSLHWISGHFFNTAVMKFRLSSHLYNSKCLLVDLLIKVAWGSCNFFSPSLALFCVHCSHFGAWTRTELKCVHTHNDRRHFCKYTVDLVKGWEEEQLKDSHSITVGGLSSLTREDKEHDCSASIHTRRDITIREHCIFKPIFELIPHCEKVLISKYGVAVENQSN